MPTAVANGIDLHYERRGRGPRLLFLSGSGQTLVTSELLLAPFVDRFDVVAHDQRGLGASAVPPGPYTIADYAADALALLDVVGWDRCRVVGVSFGGMVAQELAVTAPDRVERLALACTSAGGDAGGSYPLDELASMADAERTTVARRLLDTRFTDEWLDEHPADRLLAETIATRAPASHDPERARGEREQLLSRRTHDVAGRLGRVSCPTLVAGGRYDGIAPPENAQAIAERIPGAILRLYDGGHAFFAQDPAALPEILDFLAGDGTGEGRRAP